MNVSVLFLVMAVVAVFFAWMRGLDQATEKEFNGDPKKRKGILFKGFVLFLVLVILDLAAGVSGIFSRFDQFPPPFAVFFIVNVFAIPAVIAFSQLGKLLALHTSERALVGFQSFRILAELLIFAAVHEGIAPVQMSFEGYNPDILTALFAMTLFFWMKRHSAPMLAFAFNIFGVLALAVIGFIAIRSMPGPLRLFLNEPSNVWVTTAPYTLLPGILVSGALTAHILFFRKRALQRSS